MLKKTESGDGLKMIEANERQVSEGFFRVPMGRVFNTHPVWKEK